MKLLHQFLLRLLQRPPNQFSRPLNAPEWNKLLIKPDTKKTIVEHVRAGLMSDWCRFVVKNTNPGESILEIASGTGEISLMLAALGRDVTLLDFSPENLQFSEECAKELGITVTAVQADVLDGLPFSVDYFDCSWSSGLLEHFNSEARQAILKEQARVSRGSVISLVPNAACIAYRIGKSDQEARGVWPYGLETPLASQRDDFAAAGLSVVQECTIGPKHAISFLQKKHPLHRQIKNWICERSEAELLDCCQGYLLATVGRKQRNGL